jgi:hypothetical protein
MLEEGEADAHRRELPRHGGGDALERARPLRVARAVGDQDEAGLQ